MGAVATLVGWAAAAARHGDEPRVQRAVASLYRELLAADGDGAALAPLLVLLKAQRGDLKVQFDGCTALAGRAAVSAEVALAVARRRREGGAVCDARPHPPR